MYCDIAWLMARIGVSLGAGYTCLAVLCTCFGGDRQENLQDLAGLVLAVTFESPFHPSSP